MEHPVLLSFNNRTAKGVTILSVGREDCEPIARWYGAYHAGDDYEITINGISIEKDIDGAIATDPHYRG